MSDKVQIKSLPSKVYNDSFLWCIIVESQHLPCHIMETVYNISGRNFTPAPAAGLYIAYTLNCHPECGCSHRTNIC